MSLHRDWVCPAAVAALFAALVFSFADRAGAAEITWTQSDVDATDGDDSPGGALGDLAVSTAGVLVEAVNIGGDADVTVNGVLFEAIAFDDMGVSGGPTTIVPGPPSNIVLPFTSSFGPGFRSFGSGGTTTGQAIDDLTGSFSNNLGESVSELTLTGLTIGQVYEVQLLSSFAGLGRTSTFDDGLGNSITVTNSNPHAFANGVFTADATTQDITLTSSAGSSFLSAYQLRAIPEPSCVCLLALSGVVTVSTRGRRLSTAGRLA